MKKYLVIGLLVLAAAVLFFVCRNREKIADEPVIKDYRDLAYGIMTKDSTPDSIIAKHGEPDNIIKDSGAEIQSIEMYYGNNLFKFVNMKEESGEFLYSPNLREKPGLARRSSIYTYLYSHIREDFQRYSPFFKDKNNLRRETIERVFGIGYNQFSSKSEMRIRNSYRLKGGDLYFEFRNNILTEISLDVSRQDNVPNDKIIIDCSGLTDDIVAPDLTTHSIIERYGSPDDIDVNIFTQDDPDVKDIGIYYRNNYFRFVVDEEDNSPIDWWIVEDFQKYSSFFKDEHNLKRESIERVFGMGYEQSFDSYLNKFKYYYKSRDGVLILEFTNDFITKIKWSADR